MKTSLLVLVLSVATLTASAQQATPLQSYDVELVVFRIAASECFAGRVEHGAERCRPAPVDSRRRALARSRRASPRLRATATFPALPAAKFKLTAIADTLRRSRNYQPLAHFGWTQPGYPRGDAKFLPINSMVPASAGLLGQIALSRGRYLHLTLDLVYDAPGAAGEPTQRFVLRQSRRMRSNERHYIDRREFGVIAIVTPSGPSG